MAHVAQMVDAGRYDKHLIEDYSEAEFNQLNEYLDHGRGYEFQLCCRKTAGRKVPGSEPCYPRDL